MSLVTTKLEKDINDTSIQFWVMRYNPELNEKIVKKLQDYFKEMSEIIETEQGASQ